MKKLAIIVALASLGGCATYYPAPANYGTRAYAPVDPNGWQTVSVTPVPNGTAASAQASGDAGRVTSQPMQSYAPATVYSPVVTDQVYAPAPVYGVPVYGAPIYGGPVYDPFWYPPVSIGLGFNFGGGWGHRGGWGGGHGWGGRGFGGRGGPGRGHR
jgi:hypothetical protein